MPCFFNRRLYSSIRRKQYKREKTVGLWHGCRAWEDATFLMSCIKGLQLSTHLYISVQPLESIGFSFSSASLGRARVRKSSRARSLLENMLSRRKKRNFQNEDKSLVGLNSFIIQSSIIWSNHFTETKSHEKLPKISQKPRKSFSSHLKSYATISSFVWSSNLANYEASFDDKRIKFCPRKSLLKANSRFCLPFQIVNYIQSTRKVCTHLGVIISDVWWSFESVVATISSNFCWRDSLWEL